MKKALIVGFVMALVLTMVAQGPTVVPTNYRQQLQTAGTPAKAVDYLGWGVLAVQAQVGQLRADTNKGLQGDQAQIEQLRLEANKAFGQVQGTVSQIDQRMTATETRVTQITPPVQPATFYKQVQDLKNETDAIKKQLADLQDAACSVLKSAKLKDDDKTRVTALCPEK
jgi:hypothetical protein